MTKLRIAVVVLAVVAAAVAASLVLTTWHTSTVPVSLGVIYGSPTSEDLQFWVASCGAEFTVDVDETPDRVTLRVTTREVRGDACPAVGVVAKVSLAAPLGQRDVVDGATRTELEVREGPV